MGTLYPQWIYCQWLYPVRLKSAAGPSVGKAQVLQQGAPESIAIQGRNGGVEFFQSLAVGLLLLGGVFLQLHQLVADHLPMCEGLHSGQLYLFFAGLNEIELLPDTGIFSALGEREDQVTKLVQFPEQAVEIRWTD